MRYQDETEEVVHFFASRLKYSRWVEVTLVPDERVETLVRTLVDHLAGFGGMPLGGRLRSPEDGRAEVGPRRRGDRVESDLCRRGPRPGARRRGVLAVSARKRKAASRIWSAG